MIACIGYRGWRWTLLLAALAVAEGCSSDWPAFRHNLLRTGAQLNSSPLSNPAQVGTLSVQWTFTAPPSGGTVRAFTASPVVFSGKVYIGNGNGFFYALDAATGKLIWQYPSAGGTPLLSQFTCNPSSAGIASSAVIARIGSTDAVIFAAPDPTIGTGLGEGRLFALNAATGAVIWASPVISRLTGTTWGSTSQYHEQQGYSAPIVVGDHVYVGIADHCDNPIQKGKVVSVSLATGAIDPGFSYCSTGTCADSTRGGGVWSPIAGWGDSVVVTTGNTNIGIPEPSPNHGLSMLRLDRTTGSIKWKFQPVPFVMDGDPDWSAGATVMLASCATILVSTQKDGWTHAVNFDPDAGGNAVRRWSYPPASIPFTLGDGTVHGDTRYMRGGATWGDVYVAMNGGLNLTTGGVSGGYHRLHAFNTCAAGPDRLRWLLDVPGASGATYSLGPPTVSRGIFFIGTDLGHLVVIADPSLYPAAGWRCSNPDVTTASCVSMGYSLVPEPAVLANVTLTGSMVYNEPAIARGKIYVSTGAGNVYMLAP